MSSLGRRRFLGATVLAAVGTRLGRTGSAQAQTPGGVAAAVSAGGAVSADLPAPRRSPQEEVQQTGAPT